MVSPAYSRPIASLHATLCALCALPPARAPLRAALQRHTLLAPPEPPRHASPRARPALPALTLKSPACSLASNVYCAPQRLLSCARAGVGWDQCGVERGQRAWRCSWDRAEVASQWATLPVTAAPRLGNLQPHRAPLPPPNSAPSAPLALRPSPTSFRPPHLGDCLPLQVTTWSRSFESYLRCISRQRCPARLRGWEGESRARGWDRAREGGRGRRGRSDER